MNIIIHGSTGRMGQNLIALTEQSHTLAAAVSIEQETNAAEKKYHSLPEFDGAADLLIDFSHHTAIGAVLDYAKAKKLPVVIGTTGHTDEELSAIADAAKEIPVFHAGNYSLGIAVLMDMARRTAKAFPDAEVEIIETHHDQKLDVPSGTALMLAKAVKDGHPEATYNIGRHENGKRDPKEIGIHSLRMGNVVGVHEVIIATGTQTITLKHEAHDRKLFAEGAMVAAQWLVGQKPGLYNMETMLGG